jgi:NADH dehydrogenase (ubiquinone) flavoprotein 2
MLQKSFKLIFR